MTILDRSFGTFAAASPVTVTRSTGSYGTGTVVVVAILSNTTWQTPSGWTQRHNNVVDLGIYSYDKTAAGEASFVFAANAAGSGAWFAWELNAGSAYLLGSPSQVNTAGSSYASNAITPTAGERHLLAVVGGNGGAGNLRTVTAFSDSFTEFGDGQGLAQDYTFAAGADRNVTANGSTAYSTTATYSASASTRGAIILGYSNNAGDVTAPSVPTGLTVATVGSTTADLTWTAATDNVGVTGYDIEIVGP